MILETPLTDDFYLALLVGGTVFLTAYTVGTLLIPVMYLASWRLGTVDKPDGNPGRHSFVNGNYRRYGRSICDRFRV